METTKEVHVHVEYLHVVARLPEIGQFSFRGIVGCQQLFHPFVFHEEKKIDRFHPSGRKIVRYSVVTKK